MSSHPGQEHVTTEVVTRKALDQLIKLYLKKKRIKDTQSIVEKFAIE